MIDEDPDAILNTALRVMRGHLEAIESKNERGVMLTFDQPSHVAAFVRALGAVATAKKKRTKEDLDGKTTEELLAELMKIPGTAEMLRRAGLAP